MYLYIGTILLICVLLLLLGLLHRKTSIEKVCRLNPEQKHRLIENLAFPFGYTYIKNGDFFSSALDAWQKRFGYSALYDKSAPHFHMVFDALPVYFNYAGRTWLIEFWKGQYGIHAGGEIGIYCSDRILSKENFSAGFFQAAPEDELPSLSLCLKHRDLVLAELQRTHWWLTAFCPGTFADPENLAMDVSVTFPNVCMASAFCNALEAQGYDVCICGPMVCFTFFECHSCSLSRLKQLHRKWIQWQNRIFCRLFLWFTQPFVSSLDRVLFLFECLPAVFHRTIQFHRSSRKIRRQQ